MNTIAPTKSCVNNLPAGNEFKASLFLLCLKKLHWKSFGILVASVNAKTCPELRASSVSDTIVLANYFNTSTSRRQIVDKLFNNSICKFVESFGNSKSSLKIHNL